MQKRNRGRKWPSEVPSGGIDQLFAKKSQQEPSKASEKDETKLKIEDECNSVDERIKGKPGVVSLVNKSPLPLEPVSIKSNALVPKSSPSAEEKDEVVWDSSPPLRVIKEDVAMVSNIEDEEEDEEEEKITRKFFKSEAAHGCSTFPAIEDSLSHQPLQRCSSITKSGQDKANSCSTTGQLESWLANSPSPIKGTTPVLDTKSKLKKTVSRIRSFRGQQRGILDLLKKVEMTTQAENESPESKVFSEESPDKKAIKQQKLSPESESNSHTNVSNWTRILEYSLNEKESTKEVPEESKVFDLPSQIEELLAGTDLDAFFETPEGKSGKIQEDALGGNPRTESGQELRFDQSTAVEGQEKDFKVELKNDPQISPEFRREIIPPKNRPEMRPLSLDGNVFLSNDEEKENRGKGRLTVHVHDDGEVKVLHDCTVLGKSNNVDVKKVEADFKNFDNCEEEIEDLQHFVVIEVEERFQKNENGSQSEEKILYLSSLKNEEKIFHAILSDEWVYSPVEVGQTVGVVGKFGPNFEIRISLDSNFLILHPNILVSGSKVGSSFLCPRRSIIEERYSYGGSALPALLGTMLHEIFQIALKDPKIPENLLLLEAEKIIKENLDTLLSLDETESKVLSEIKERIPKILQFVTDFCRPFPPSELNLEPTRSSSSKKSICISEVVDVEESIWSPRFGLKGMVDSSISIRVKSGDKGVHSQVQGTEIVPLELKTGKSTSGQTALEHRAQVMLYTLLMSERYNRKIQRGILHYLHTGVTQEIETLRRELVGIIMRRNEHANGMLTAGTTGQLPPMLKSSHLCQNCGQLEVCTILHKGFENGNEESSGIGPLFTESTQHLKDSELGFLRHWSQLIDLEATESQKQREEIWSVESEIREAYGRALSNMVLNPQDVMENQPKSGHIGPFLYRFHKAGTVFPNSKKSRKYLESQGPKAFQNSQLEEITRKKVPGNFQNLEKFFGGNLLNLPFSEGDRVLLSVENKHFGLSYGTVQQISKDSVGILVHKRLRLWGGDSRISSSERLLREFWRIDKDESGGFWGLLRGNLMIFLSDSKEVSRKRKLIVNLEKPKFRNPSEGTDVEIQEEIEKSEQKGSSLDAKLCEKKTQNLIKGEENFGNSDLENERNKFDGFESFNWRNGLNEDQKTAASRVLEAEDYSLILGTPGSGKSTAIVHIIMALLELGKKVLLTSYTNSAVDNVLLKLKKKGIKFLRIGRASAVHPEILSETFCEEGIWFDSVSEMSQNLANFSVFGATCLGINHPIFDKMKNGFDFCIVDEASQITLPAVLGPLNLAKRFVLVGDHNQLPPLVKSEDARKSGMDVSLFQILSNAHPDSVTVLSTQYRMCTDIMTISNYLVYKGQLKCGTESIADSKMVLKMPEAPSLKYGPLPQWLEMALNPNLRVLFFDTDSTMARERKTRENRFNLGEAAFALSITKLLLLGKMDGDVGIISPYVAQVKNMKRVASKAKINGFEVDTVDRFQGRDKECVLVSFVCSNLERPNVGRHVADLQRLNVALTRAKQKLILIGSRSTLMTAEITRGVVELVEEKGWMWKLPVTAEVDCVSILGDFLVEQLKVESHFGDKDRSETLKPCISTGLRI